MPRGTASSNGTKRATTSTGPTKIHSGLDSEDWDFWRCRREALFARSFEFDSRRGVVRDRIAAIMHEWIGVITRAIYDAQNAGHVDPRRWTPHAWRSRVMASPWGHTGPTT